MMATTPSCCAPQRTSTCSPWLQAALADIEERVRDLSLSTTAEEEPDSFADRAENYYRKRPQLIALLHDLHNRYLYLADRYTQALLKPHHNRHTSTASFVSDDGDGDGDRSAVSDAESSLSFQPHQDQPDPHTLDLVIADLVMTKVERHLLLDELGEADLRRSESARKIELQRSLLEVMESERMVLIGENARLGFRAAAAAEEAGYIRRKAADMGRVLVKMREDHRVCLLGRKIEVLQAQIYGLERRNRECYEAMVRREMEKGEARAEMDRLRGENRRLREAAGRRRARWWGRFWQVECVPCGPYGTAKKGCFQC